MLLWFSKLVTKTTTTSCGDPQSIDVPYIGVKADAITSTQGHPDANFGGCKLAFGVEFLLMYIVTHKPPMSHCISVTACQSRLLKA